ncbi:alpha/beta fold hydrolase [Deinococcus aestuarii]|uniref:alpha/beta fold hydrolase n=1 Tax=Deinococcus aestuarii TaxID=2774531 RepID=UPI001C0D0CD3|nr:alpha/beta hydrolase [Deinococcus aestuarii]
MTHQTTAGTYAELGGLNLYYERHGTPRPDGAPLVLLHGGFGATSMFSGLIPALSARREVIAVDLQAHGRTADIDRPMRFETLGDDVAGLLGHLKLPQADVLGYSLGAGAALRFAVQHSGSLRKLVVVSFPFRRSGWFPEVREGMAQIGPHTAEGLKQGPMHSLYTSLAPHPDDWPRLVTRVGEVVNSEHDWADELREFRNPTLIVAGDADSFAPAHAAEFFALLGGGLRDAGWDGSGRTAHRLAVLPGATHYDILQSPLLLPAVTAFLDAP